MTVVDPASEAYEERPDIEPGTVHKLVFEYLVHNCFPQTAEAFLKDTQFHDNQNSKLDSLLHPSTINHQNLVSCHTGHLNNNNKDIEGDFEMADATAHESINKKQKMNNAIDNETIDTTTATVTSSSSSSSNMHCGNNYNQQDYHSNNSSTIKPNTITSHAELISKTLKSRHAICSVIIQGDILKAIQLTLEFFPDALSGSKKESMDVYFELESQHFIELVRQGRPEEALHFVQREFAKYAAQDKKYLDQLALIISLIAYPDPTQSNLSHELDLSRRDQVASLLNQYLLKLNGLKESCGLDHCIKQATVTREFLNIEATKEKKANKIVYPVWSLNEFLGKDPI